MIRNVSLVVVLGLCWGFNWPAVRLALTGLPPLALRSIGFSAAAVLMFATVAALGLSPKVPRRHWLRLAAVGVFAIAAYNLFTAYAQLSASTSRSAVLSYTMPVWAVLLARLVLGEPLDGRRIAGLALGIAGLLALGLPIVTAGEASWGLLWALLSGIVWAVGNVLLKRFPIDAPMLVVVTWQLALAALLCTVAMLLIEGAPDHLPGTAAAWAGLLYNIVVGQALATTLWFTILARMPAGIAAIGSLLVPGIGVVSAALVLGEQPTIFDWAGLVLIVSASATVLLRAADLAPGSAATVRS